MHGSVINIIVYDLEQDSDKRKAKNCCNARRLMIFLIARDLLVPSFAKQSSAPLLGRPGPIMLFKLPIMLWSNAPIFFLLCSNYAP